MQALHSVLNMPEYALTELSIYLGFSICSGSRYARVTEGPKYATIQLNMSEFAIDRVLNMYHTIYSTRPL